MPVKTQTTVSKKSSESHNRPIVVCFGHPGDDFYRFLIDNNEPDVYTFVFDREQLPPNRQGWKAFYADTVELCEIAIMEAFAAGYTALKLANASFVEPKPDTGYDHLLHACHTAIMKLIPKFGNSVIDGWQGVWNMAQNAKHCLPGSLITQFHCGDAPFLALGGGPSLKTQLDTIRAVQDSFYIVCPTSILDLLLREGIKPDFVTALERTADQNTTLLREHYDDIVYAGLPAVHNGVVKRFSRHMCICNTDVQYLWWAGDEAAGACKFHGESGGTTGVALAASLTKGPIYLCGHDLCYDGEHTHIDGHEGGNQMIHEGNACEVVCVDGKTRQSCYWWDQFRRNLAVILAGRPQVYNCSKTGAVIAGTELAEIPSSVTALKKRKPPQENRKRLHDFNKRLRLLAKDMQGARRKVLKADTADDMAVSMLFPKRSRPVMSNILRSVYCQFAIEKKQGRDDIVEPMREALGSVLKGLHTQCVEMLP